MLLEHFRGGSLKHYPWRFKDVLGQRTAAIHRPQRSGSGPDAPSFVYKEPRRPGGHHPTPTPRPEGSRRANHGHTEPGELWAAETPRDRIYMYFGALSPPEAPRDRIYMHFGAGRRAKHRPQWCLAHPGKR